MLKRSLALGALMAFVITGQAWSAQVVDQNLIVNQNQTIITDSFNDGTFGTGNRTVALGYTSGNNNTVTIGADTTLKLVNKYANATRSYGIVVHNPVNGASLDISGGVNSVVDLDVEVANRAQGVRNNYNGTLNINVGLLDVNVKMTGDSVVTYGMDVWQGSTTNINTDTKGTTKFYVEAAKGSVYGIQGWNDGEVYHNADGKEVPYSNDNAVVNINDLDLTVKSTHQNSTQTERDKQGRIVLRGINLHATNMNLVGDTTNITLTNDGKYLSSAIVALQGNHSDAPTVLNFNAATTTLKATGGNGNNAVVGVSASGDSSQINFNGDSVLVDIDGGNANVIGVNAQYKGNTVTGLEKTSIKVDVESKTDENVVGIGAHIYSGSAGNIDFAGDTTVFAKNNGSGSALGVYAEAGGNVTLDGDVVYIDVSGASNDMSGVYVRNETRKSADEPLGESEVTLGNAGSNVTVKVNSTNGDVQGLWASKYTATGHNNEYNSLQDTKAAVINVKGKDVLIDVATTGSGNASAVFAASKTENGVTQEANKSKISIEADNTTINVKAASGVAEAIIAHSDSVVDITKGNLYVTANDGKGYVVSTRGNADVKLGCAGKETQLNGDILFDYASNGGNNIDSSVDVTLDGVNSWFTGKIIKDNEIPADANSDVTGMTIALSNGATWNLTGASIVTNATFGADSVLNIDGTKYTGADYALNASEGDTSLTVEQGAVLAIKGIEEGTTYNIAQGFNVAKTEGEKWTIDNNLLTGTWTDTEGLQVTTKAKDAGQIAEDMGVDSGTASALGSIINAANSDSVPDTEAAQNVVKFAQEIASASPEVAAAAAEAVIKMAEAGGNSATAASIVKNVTGVTNDRLSFNCGHSAPHKGGHGVGLFEEGSGADIWVEYVHGKDKVEDMPSSAGATSYEGQYNGFVMGVDFKKVNKFQSGIAFNYGEGDTNTVGSAVRTHSDYDFWGVGYYGNIHNDDSNVIFDINYAKTDSDVTNKNISGLNYEASPETTTWSAGVKLEKLYQNENVQIVPYTGLRYMSIDPDDYATKCGTYKYSMDRQDIWLLPLGVSIRQEVANDNGWTVSPRVDLSYIWAFGDTDSDMEFATALNTKTNIGYDVMDDGSFLGLVGIEAHKGQWGYGVAYSYQKGDHSESKKWYVDVNYSF